MLLLLPMLPMLAMLCVGVMRPHFCLLQRCRVPRHHAVEAGQDVEYNHQYASQARPAKQANQALPVMPVIRTPAGQVSVKFVMKLIVCGNQRLNTQICLTLQ